MGASKKNDAGGIVKASRKLDSFFGRGTRMNGTLRFNGNVRFDGVFEGKIVSTGKLLIGETGDVDARIEIGSLLTSGKVRGNIKAGSRVQILPCGQIDGDVNSPVLQIDPGAIFNGRSEMPPLLPEKAGLPPRGSVDVDVGVGVEEERVEVMCRDVGTSAGIIDPVRRGRAKRTILTGAALLLPVIFWVIGNFVFTETFFETTEDMGLVVVNRIFETNREKRLLEKGQEFKRAGELKKAVSVFRKLSDIADTGSDTRLILARVFQELGDEEAALLEYNRLLRLAPDNIEVRREYLKALIRNNHESEAVTEIKKILAVNPEDFSVQLELAALYRKTGRVDELYDQLALMARQVPDHIETLKELATLQISRGEKKKGRETYSKIVELDPDNVESNMALARLNFRAGFETSAGIGFARHERLEPDNIEVMNNEGFRQVNMHNYDMAIKTFKTVLDADPDNLRARFGVVTARAKMGYTSKAISLCEDVLRVFPDVVPFQNRLAWLYARKRVNLKRAMELSGKAVDANPGSPDYLDTLSLLYFLNGNRKRAVEYINRAIELSPGNRYYESQLVRFKSRAGR